MRYETPAHLYPAALVADDDAGDAPEFVLPEDLTGLSAEFSDDGELIGGELHDLEVQATEAFDAIRDSGLDDEALAHLSTLADAVDAIRAEAGRRNEAAVANAAAADALAQRVHASAEDESTDGDGEGDETEGGDGDGEGEPAGSETEQEPVVASAGPTRVPLSRIRAQAPAPAPGLQESPVAIVAAADVPGISGGARVTREQLPRLMHGRVRGLSNGGSALVASIEVENEYTVNQGDSKSTMADVIDAARSLDVLTAAGGWCAPNDRLWDLFNVAEVTGLWDVPTITIDRGGLEWPVAPSIASVMSVPWLWTEQDDIDAAGNPHEDPEDDRTKPCFRVPCPTWDDERLRAHGVCLTHGNLSDAAWPENSRNYADLVMAAHAHVMNARALARLTAIGNAVTIAATAGAVAPLLSAIELQVLDYRDKFRMGESTLLEGVFDHWVPGVVRADIARRSGVQIEDVPNSRISGWFEDRGLRPQFVHDWHPLQTGATPAGDGFRETWPTDIVFGLYAAGTVVKGRGPSIDLGVMRDSRLNETNDHTLVWTEESDLVAKIGHEVRIVTVPACPNGSTAPAHGALVCPIG